MKILEIKTKVKAVQRLENSLNGNPQYRIHTTNGTVDTPKDSQVAYEYNFDSYVDSNVKIYYYLDEVARAKLQSIMIDKDSSFDEDVEEHCDFITNAILGKEKL
ncbi:hypothetical protein [Hyphomonas sp.]|uniref:hypothetical protein n=1 Tax=Hyphomonas sp. TaxID=87 RepID=UPI0025C4DBDB|nr:hypothetical protein [Hyphomonas sp.]